MKGFAVLAMVGAAAAMPQAVTSKISPTASAPSGCATSYSGQFEISVVNVTGTTKRSLHERTALEITLTDGVLTDAQGRTGYIASNDQFQFDNPVQAGAIYTAGWSVCSNNTLALGGSAIFYQCLSGTFYNLYDESEGAQCNQIYIDVVGGGSVSTAGAAVSTQGDGQVTASSAPAVTQITDGQIQASTGVVSQISDGQIQATTGVVVSQISDGQIQATTGAVVSQISDGQIQATTAAAVVSQISDGQIQATTGAVVSQISDGQIQATTGAVVSQISDGQIQATTAKASATSVKGAVASQISDGQIQASGNGTNPTATTATPSVATYTGAAVFPSVGSEMLLAAGAIALAML